jgi:hypothetical protein
MSPTTKTTTRKPKLLFFQNKNKEWHWHITGGNGQIIDQGSQGDGFSRLQRAIDNFNISTRNRLMMVQDSLNISDKQMQGLTKDGVYRYMLSVKILKCMCSITTNLHSFTMNNNTRNGYAV